MLPEPNGFFLVRSGNDLPFALRCLRQDGQKLLGGQIVQFDECCVGGLVVRDFRPLEPAAVRELIEVLPRADAEIHVGDIDSPARLLSNRHTNLDHWRDEHQRGQDGRPQQFRHERDSVQGQEAR